MPHTTTGYVRLPCPHWELSRDKCYSHEYTDSRRLIVNRRTRLILLSVVVGVSLLLAGCFTRSVDPADVFKVVIDLTDYAYDANLDFGLVNPDGDPSVVAGELHNITDGDITVT